MALHRLVAKSEPGEEVLFRDGDSLNCTRQNLVRATRADILHHQSVNRRNTTGYKGVSRLRNGKYRAYICVKGERKYLGTFTNVTDAAIAYNKAALSYFGEWARLNVVGSFMGENHQWMTGLR